MGYLIIDHRSTCDPSGTKDGKLEQWDTTCCVHCQKVIRILILDRTRKAPDTKHRCDTCRKPICNDCAEIMSITRVCPGPFKAQIDRIEAGRKLGEQISVSFSSSMKGSFK